MVGFAEILRIKLACNIVTKLVVHFVGFNDGDQVINVDTDDDVPLNTEVYIYSAPNSS